MKHFLNYYHDELLFLRNRGGEFARKHPDIAGKLDIKNAESTDPQTERIIESVAFMSAHLHQKIDNNAQNIAFFLLSALYPNLITAFPPSGLVRFDHEESGAIPNKVFINKGTALFVNSKNNIECQFKTLYPISLYSFEIEDVSLRKSGKKTGGIDGWSLNIDIVSPFEPIDIIEPDDLLFHINMEFMEDSLALYESIFSNPNRTVFLKINETYLKVDNSSIVPCGFEQDETISPTLEYTLNSFQLFQELIHFKQKFMFFRILNLSNLIRSSGINGIREISIIIDVENVSERLVQMVSKHSLLMNVVPIVNLFPLTSDPFRFDGTKTKYLLRADQSKRDAVEIHSISELHTINNSTQEDQIIQPYFSLEIDSDTNVIHDLYWLYSKEESATYISLVDTKMNPYKPYEDIVYAKLLCSNRFETRDIPLLTKMHIDKLEIGGYSARLLTKTMPANFSAANTDLWNLVLQLSSMHISISSLNDILSHIRDLMCILSGNAKSKIEELMGGIESISIKDIVRRFGKDAWRGFVRGVEFTIEANERYSPLNYLFICVLNQYLSSIISMNSFCQLKVFSTIANTTKASWNPTSGRKNLV